MVVGHLVRNKQREFEDGTKYDGNWEHGLFHGYGKLEWGEQVPFVVSLPETFFTMTEISLTDIAEDLGYTA